ncbi:unannotated protein [freshwater metagenome]|uniref:Unannotated protein n=1 Tax=freshwater metagenome TaxID=449393 RepID=A0A6J6B0W3_9ZZZZ
MNCRQHQKRWDWGEVFIGVTVAEYDKHCAIIERCIDFLAHLVESLFHGLGTLVNSIQARNGVGDGPTVLLKMNDLC